MDAETKKKRPVYSTTPMWTPKAKPPTKAKELEEEAAAEKKKILQAKDAGFREDIAIKVAAKTSKGKALDGDGLCLSDTRYVHRLRHTPRAIERRGVEKRLIGACVRASVQADFIAYPYPALSTRSAVPY